MTGFSFVTDSISYTSLGWSIWISTIICFMLLEFTLFYLFFKSVIIGKKIKILLRIFLFSYYTLSAVTLCYIFIHRKYHIGNVGSATALLGLMLFEAILLIIPTLFYYKSLFENNTRKILTRDPTFLIMTGILFCFSIPIPIYTLGSLILKMNPQFFPYLYLFNAVGYIFLHSFFIKTYTTLN